MSANNFPKRLITADDFAIEQAAICLKNGNLVAFPTETVYGLGGNALDDAAIALIYQTKSRRAENPLILHIADAGHARNYARISALAQHLMMQYWPGPLTLVLDVTNAARLPPALVSPQGSIALRLPSHPIARKLIAQCGFPLAAPSANISGKLSPTRAAHVMQAFANADQPRLILDDSSPCQMGIESTIIDARGSAPKILRHGGCLIKADAESCDADSILAPGMLPSHYAPNSPVRLNAREAEHGEVLLGFADIGSDNADALNLSAQGDLAEAAYHLYDYLFRLDQKNPVGIAVAPIPMRGLGIAINDRLNRAAHHCQTRRHQQG